MIITLWVLALVMIVLTLDYNVAFVPSLAACAVTNIHAVAPIIYVVPDVLVFMLILFVSAYLRYKIIKSNRFIHGI